MRCSTPICRGNHDKHHHEWKDSCCSSGSDGDGDGVGHTFPIDEAVCSVNGAVGVERKTKAMIRRDKGMISNALRRFIVDLNVALCRPITYFCAFTLRMTASTNVMQNNDNMRRKTKSRADSIDHIVLLSNALSLSQPYSMTAKSVK